MSKVKAAVAAVYRYFIANPGAVTLVLGWVAAAVAHFGVQASAQQLFLILITLVPAFAGAHLVARKGREKAAVKAAAVPAVEVVPEAVPVAEEAPQA